MSSPCRRSLIKRGSSRLRIFNKNKLASTESGLAIGFIKAGPSRRAALRVLAIALPVLLLSCSVLVRAFVTQYVPPPVNVQRSHSILSEHVGIRVVGAGDSHVRLTDGREVLTACEGPDELVLAVEQNRAKPLSLASADFDEDGVVDLVSGYADKGAGIITLMRGNVDSIYPGSAEARQRKAEGSFTEAPFLSPAAAFSLPVAAEFLAAGDFDRDGHLDVVATSRGARSMYILRGDGKGFYLPQSKSSCRAG